MQMNDSQRIPAPKEKVWAAINDPEILKQCIPGCQSLDMSSATEMTATVVRMTRLRESRDAYSVCWTSVVLMCRLAGPA